MLSLLGRLKKDGIPVDALGIQGHLVASRDDFDEHEWSGFLAEIEAMGLRVLITELDVADSGLPADFETRDKIVADHARAFLDVTLSFGNVTDLLTWGLSDSYSAVHLNHARKDGRRNRSNPYDDRLSPKRLRSAIAKALSAAPSRDASQGKLHQ
jgi:endo-1,4-beta-xylanase